ncbi:hypothetical protein KY289_001388 [Solanum tuberosum]|nr:hypothetical protein KY289_001388 [Solanum tuberosum]
MASFPFQLSIIDRTGSRWFPFLLLNVSYPSLKARNLRGVVTWTDFKEDLCDRFDAEHLDDIMDEFKWLEQTESVDMFLGKFEDLKAQMLVRNQHLVESHFVSSFMEGLKENIRQPYEGKHYFGQGTVKNRNLAILIDSGSTYKFMDEGNVKETGQEVSYCPPVRVTVADRNYVMCTSHCQEFSWKMKDIPH